MMIRWEPFGEISTLQEQINSLFDQAYRPRAAEHRGGPARSAWTPAVDVSETEKEITLTVDLPGIRQEDIDLQVTADQLVLRGERKPTEEKGRNYLRQERIYGPFQRSFSLTIPIQRDRVRASYKAGVLEIALPKSEEVMPKNIKIQVQE